MKSETKVFLSIYLPNWSTDLIRSRSHKQPVDRAPCLLVTESRSGPTVMRCCKQAADHGVSPGMSLILAQALLPQAQIRQFDIKRDLRALYRLAAWMIKFSPTVGFEDQLLSAIKSKDPEQTSPELIGLILEIGGSKRLFGDYHNLADLVYQQLKRWQINTKIAVAPTLGAAWALSRFRVNAITIINQEQLTESLKALPPQALRISQAINQSLQELGICTIAQLLKLPSQQLNTRFGAELLLKLEQALGRHPELFRTIKPHQPYQAKKVFESAITSQLQIQKLLLSLVETVLKQLRHEKKKARNFSLTLRGHLNDGKSFTVRKELQLAFASHNSSQLYQLLEPLLGSLQAPEGFFSFSVRANQITTVPENKQAFLINDPSLGSNSGELFKGQKIELLNLLISRIGRDNVSKLKINQSHLPEHSYQHLGFNHQTRIKHDLPPEFAAIAQSRPSYILKTPLAIRAIALLPDQAPAQIECCSELLRIVSGFGPERIQSAWWQQDRSDQIQTDRQRDYFTIQDQFGRWLWVFRNLTNFNWYLHGFWI